MKRGLKLAGAVLLLNASLAFENVWPTPLIIWRGTFSIECFVFLLAVAGLAIGFRPPGRVALRWIAVAWVVLVLGRYAQVTAPALYGRDVNLYWDLRFIPDVVAMGTRVAPAWLTTIVCAAGGLTLVGLYAVVRRALGAIAAALADVRASRGLIVLSAAVCLLFAAQQSTSAMPEMPRFSPSVASSYARQVRFAGQAMRGPGIVPPSPAINSDLSAVKDADVLLVFIEAYGATAYDRPEFASGLAASRRQLDAAIAATGRRVVSAFVGSPTFGGSSWLAHLTLLSGVEVRDPDTNARLMAQHRDTLVRLFARQGYRTVALMPGLRQSWPEGAFYGFDQIYGAKQIDYHGPEFGWFAIPDQFALDRLRALEMERRSRPPVFVFFPTISTHFPFSPTPPYQADWSRMQTAEPYDADEIVRAYSEQPDWTNFGPGYVEALSYDFASLAGFLRMEADRDFVMVLVGDHQPAAAVSGEGASWDVPVHVIASHSGVVDRLLSHRFSPGLMPQRASIGGMQTLLPILLDAFGKPLTATR